MGGALPGPVIEELTTNATPNGVHRPGVLLALARGVWVVLVCLIAAVFVARCWCR